jgi:hypothetical protein
LFTDGRNKSGIGKAQGKRFGLLVLNCGPSCKPTTVASNKFAIIACGFALATVSGLRAEQPLFTSRPTCYEFALVANRYIKLGEDGAITELIRNWRDVDGDLLAQEDRREQIGWICRMIFMPKTAAGIRRPLFGGLGMPFDAVSDTDWPIYPMAESNGVFFLLARGYTLAGMPEDPISYLAYCRANGVFRHEEVRAPTEGEATLALEHLFESPSWKHIKWKGDQPYPYDADPVPVIRFMRRQLLKAGSD